MVLVAVWNEGLRDATRRDATHLSFQELPFKTQMKRREEGQRRRRRGTMRCGLGVALTLVVMMMMRVVVGTRAAVDFELGGSVGDASCDVKDVEGANEAQLHSILSELTNTTFFRLFQVDLKRKCKFWGKGEDTGPSCTAPSGDGGLPFTTTPASRESDASGSFSKSSEPPKTMCSLDLEKKDGVGMLWSPMTDSVDRTISKPEEKALTSMEEPDVDCSDEELPTFWTDMCHKFAPEEQTEYVNLQLNPERWTGYNGSHVWRAIYEENCMKSALSVDEMCYEERVLYRLLSGMHASINIHIALHSKPPKRALGETEWGSDPKKFMDLFGKHPDRLKNLHFSFVVLLRALRKATPALAHMDVSIGQDREEDLRTQALMRRLLDSHILSSCRDVFGAFDEKSLFRDVQSTLNSDVGKIDQLDPNDLAPVSLKSQFKDIFLNISEVMDCISCQKCKLHGKLQLLGLGTALKVLLLPEDLLASSLNQQEVVALVNTIAKFSHAIRSVPDLLNAARQEALKGESDFVVDSDATRDGGSQSGQSALEAAIAATASHVKSGVLSSEAETKILDALMENDSKVSILAKYYAESMPLRFVEHALRALGLPPLATSAVDEPVDLVVVGGGLAGLTASLTVLDRGGRVTLVEKEAFVGGNSQWASSGINGVIKTARDEENPDSVGAYRDDCEKSSYGNGNGADGLDPETIEHIPTLTSKAGETIEWLRQRAGANLSLLSRLGGHSHARTYRPNEGMAGSSLVFALKAKCEEYMESGRFKVVKKARVTRVSTDGDGQIVGVQWTPADGSKGGGEVKALNVLLATGGYSNDKHGSGALLNMYAPHLTKFATTNTKGTTGDGHKLAFSLGAGAVDMERVQVHPTGFINPEDENADTKTLAAELLRGAGGILLTRSGVRFANELGTRDYVSSRMQEEDEEKLDFVLLLNEKAANEANKHVPLYLKKKLLNKFDSLAELTEWMSSRGDVSVETLKNTLVTYNQDAERGRDIFNKTFFANAPFDLDGPYYAGRVTPVVHYTMGGVKVDDSGRVVRADGSRVNGLYAAGEIIGGVHGKNRLGGNALTECAVFGRLVGQDVEIEATKAAAPSATTTRTDAPPRQTKNQDINAAELAKHNTMTDCWVALYGKVYDFTDFLEDHPAGADAILRYSGADGTDIFESVHSRNMLDEFEPIGTFLAD